MAEINENFLQLGQRYLFQEVAARVARYTERHPEADLIRMGIGDVTLPLAPAVVAAMRRAVDDQAAASSFHGYGPERGHEFLRRAITRGDFESRGVEVSADEVFVSDGAKSDTGNIGDILGAGNLVGVTDPVYPVYVDTNRMAGRRIQYIPCTESNGFTGDIPSNRLDLLYLCYPNNPTGAVITRDKLARWVEYALANDTIILYDSAYEAFIRDADIPHSIFEIPGARRCAIEFRSFSKTAGFTGVRCGYTVVPKELTARAADGSRVPLNALWERRQSCKFNGASYISQRGAEAVYSPEGRSQITAAIDHYLETAAIIRDACAAMGLRPAGGGNSPYIWARTPGGMDSWEFFDRLLDKARVVVTPGAGFGEAGQGYFRLTAFADRRRSAEAMERMASCINSL